jgi:hypothetical protein
MSNAQKAEIVPLDQSRVPTAHTPMDLLNQAVASGNIELAEKLMGLHERWEKNQARKAFDAAISTAKAAIPPIVRNRSGHNSKKYADFAAIALVVDPILSTHGLGYRFRSTQTDARISVTCILFHRDGHAEDTTLSGPADTSGSKNAIQAIGSTLTYLQRYSLVQMLGLAASDDDNGHGSGNGSAITAEQLKTLEDKFAQVGGVSPATLAYFEVASLAELPAKNFERVLAAVNKKIGDMA